MLFDDDDECMFSVDKKTCRAINVKKLNGCVREKFHSGPHRDWQGEEWENLGNGICYAEHPDHKTGCLQDFGHTCKHQDYQGREW